MRNWSIQVVNVLKSTKTASDEAGIQAKQAIWLELFGLKKRGSLRENRSIRSPALKLTPVIQKALFPARSHASLAKIPANLGEPASNLNVQIKRGNSSRQAGRQLPREEESKRENSIHKNSKHCVWSSRAAVHPGSFHSHCTLYSIATEASHNGPRLSKPQTKLTKKPPGSVTCWRKLNSKSTYYN